MATAQRQNKQQVLLFSEMDYKDPHLGQNHACAISKHTPERKSQDSWSAVFSFMILNSISCCFFTSCQLNFHLWVTLREPHSTSNI